MSQTVEKCHIGKESIKNTILDVDADDFQNLISFHRPKIIR